MDSPTSGRRLARFGPFEADLAAGILRKDGISLHLQGQPFRLLAALIEQQGAVVTRDELRTLLWSDQTFVDFEHGLNAAVRKLRVALDDSAEEPRYVETLARRGYRFVAPVEWLDQERPSRRRRWMMPAAAVVAIVAAVIISREAIQVKFPPPVRRIAVLPLTNDDAQSQYVTDGLSERILDELSSSPALRITARTSAFRYRETPIDYVRIGRELNVSTIVRGEYENDDRNFEIRMEMIETADGAQAWAATYRGANADLFRIQRQIVADLSLRLGVTRADERHARHASAAYDLYLRGRYLWNRRSRENLLRAAEYFERAAEVDPDFGLAYAGLATTYGALAGNQLIPGSENVLRKKAAAAVEKALSLDDNLAEAYASRGAGRSSHDFDFAGAESDFRRAIALNPSYASAHQWYAELLWATGRLAEARREIDIAYEIDPFSVPVTTFTCWSYLMERRYEDVIEFSKRASVFFPLFRAWKCHEWALLKLGRYEQAIAAVQIGNAKLADELAAAFRSGGVEAYWRKRISQMPSHAIYDLAMMHAALGEKDQAFAYLTRAAKDRCCSVSWFYADPRFDPLRPDPRFDQLARQIGLPQVSSQ